MAGIASRMRMRATVQAGGRDEAARHYHALIEFASEIEACIAELVEAQPAPAVWRCVDSDNCTLACDHKGDHAKTHFCEARCSSRGCPCNPVALKDAPHHAFAVNGIHCAPRCPNLQPYDNPNDLTARCTLTGHDLIWHDYWVAECAVPEAPPAPSMDEGDVAARLNAPVDAGSAAP
jgi:hypothetical protein